MDVYRPLAVLGTRWRIRTCTMWILWVRAEVNHHHHSYTNLTWADNLLLKALDYFKILLIANTPCVCPSLAVLLGWLSLFYGVCMPSLAMHWTKWSRYTAHKDTIRHRCRPARERVLKMLRQRWWTRSWTTRSWIEQNTNRHCRYLMHTLRRPLLLW